MACDMKQRKVEAFLREDLKSSVYQRLRRITECEYMRTNDNAFMQKDVGVSYTVEYSQRVRPGYE